MIYIISPFWHEDESVRDRRRNIAIRYTDALIKRGVNVFCPLKYSQNNITKSTKEEGYWLSFDVEIMRCADEVHVLKVDGWKESKGVAIEIKEADKLKIPIKYISTVSSISIMGSRTLTSEQCVPVLKDVMEELNPRRIVIPAEPAGACAVARKFAIDTHTETLLICKQVHRAAGQYEARTAIVLAESDCCVFLHDGISKGTRNEVEMCIELGIPYIYYKLDGDKLKKSKYIKNSDTGADDNDNDISVSNMALDLDFNFDI